MPTSLPSVTIPAAGATASLGLTGGQPYFNVELYNASAFTVQINGWSGGSFTLSPGQDTVVPYNSQNAMPTAQGINNSDQTGTLYLTGYVRGETPYPVGSAGSVTSIAGGTVDAKITGGTVDATITNASIPVSGAVDATITNASIPVTGTLDANITNASIDANITNATLEVTTSSTSPPSFNVANASIPVTGSLDANITNASIPVTGTVNANITNATIDANITNASVEITTSSSSPPNFNVANAITANISGGSVDVANQVSTSIDATSVTLNTDANVSNTVLGVNPLQALGSASFTESVTVGSPVSVSFNNGSPAMLIDEIWIVVETTTYNASDYSYQIGNVVYWPIPNQFVAINQPVNTIARNGTTGIYKLALGALIANGFVLQISNASSTNTLSDTFKITAWFRYASSQTGVLTPPGAQVDYSATLATAGTVQELASANPTRTNFFVWNSSSDNLSFQFGSSGPTSLLIPAQGANWSVSELPFMVNSIYATPSVNNQPITVLTWES